MTTILIVLRYDNNKETQKDLENNFKTSCFKLMTSDKKMKN